VTLNSKASVVLTHDTAFNSADLSHNTERCAQERVDSSGRNENTRKGGVWVEPCISSTADAFSHAPPAGTNDT
jgi:hypothetical protein